MEGGIKIKNLSCSAMEEITGGANWIGIALVVAAVVVFISGVINGYTNPERCGAE